MRNVCVLLLKKEMSFSAFMEDLRKRFRNYNTLQGLEFEM
jgi:hypothetical protein